MTARLCRGGLSDVLYRRTQLNVFELFVEVWGDILEQAIVDWKPTTELQLVRQKAFVARLRDRDRALDADAILSEMGGNAEGAGTGGQD